MIALVVTIVVLIILATISIYVVLGENGLITKSQKAKDFYEQAKQEEQNDLDNVGEYMGEYLNGYSGGSITLEMPNTWDKTKVTAIDDGKGNPVPLPNNFYYVGGDIDTGIVISDKPGDTMDASGISMGNQFVWIPVANATNLERTEFNNGQPTTNPGDSYTEPLNYNENTGYGTEESEYNTMRTQVLKYGGFYIGRFEAGVNTTILRVETTTVQAAVSKKGVAPYNYVPWGKNMNDIDSDITSLDGKNITTTTKGAVYLAKNMYSTSSSVASTLCYGCEWDAMCRYIGDSGRTTQTKPTAELTGSVSTDVSKNIYDLAGNCHEWTMEANSTDYRVARGGYYDYSVSVSNRISYGYPTDSQEANGFRCALYIK